MDLETELNEIKQKVSEFEEKFKQHRHTGTDSQNIDATTITLSELGLPDGLSSAPLGSIAAPATQGGIYSQSDVQSIVAAVNTIITRMETFGLVDEN